ncbi:hypothetical protein D3C73_1332460 [compost metagenome]
MQHRALAGAGPGLVRIGKQQGVQWLPGERCRQRYEGGVAADGARQIDPVELPYRSGCLPCRGLQLRSAAAQQRTPQVEQLQVFAIAIHPAITGAYQ